MLRKWEKKIGIGIKIKNGIGKKEEIVPRSGNQNKTSDIEKWRVSRNKQIEDFI